MLAGNKVVSLVTLFLCLLSCECGELLEGGATIFLFVSFFIGFVVHLNADLINFFLPAWLFFPHTVPVIINKHFDQIQVERAQNTRDPYESDYVFLKEWDVIGAIASFTLSHTLTVTCSNS